ncbi:MAG TPA: Gfo/Idh/MocA family oxidoreductase [Nitrospira sp.]|nr:Gfo/Idh/MocA family oxidoreductase [Nitrospira sp.]
MQARSRDNTSSTPLGIGLVGVGRHGSRYMQHLLDGLPGAALTAICRRSGGASYPGTEIPMFNDYRAMIADRRVDAVVVVTPPSLCHDICVAAVQAGKPILIEKPLALNGREARAMVAAADQRQVLLMTAQTMRFDPTIMLLREQLHTIGRLQSATVVSHIETKANFIAGTNGPVAVGALLELGIHLLDLIRFLTGEDILDVQCTTTPRREAGPETRAHVNMRTSGGILCTLDIARVEHHRKGMAEWIGSSGTITADWVARTVTRTANDGPPRTWTVEPRPTILAILQAFVQAIRMGTTAPITGLDGCLAVEAADACYRSAALGGAAVTCDPAGR